MLVHGRHYIPGWSAHGRYNTASSEDLRRDRLQSFSFRIIDQRSMSCRGKEKSILGPTCQRGVLVRAVGLTHVVWIDIAWLQQGVQFRTEFTRVVFPHGTIRIVQPVFLRWKPIRLISPCLGDKIDLKAGLAKDLERVQGFSNEKAYWGS
jgi:hypothetical protein